jgi:dephospho-CoA kinase
MADKSDFIERIVNRGLTARAAGLKSGGVATGKKKPIIGILGGVGAGKSTVAAEFAKLGCAVIDADKIAHELLGTEAIKERIGGQFGAGVFDARGQVDREKLAEVVFADAAKLRVLNEIMHPEVLHLAEELIRRFQADEKVCGVVLDMPLLLEVGWDKHCDSLVFVDCLQKIRLARLKQKGFIDEKQFRARENFQISLDSKAKIAHYIVGNNSDLSALGRQVFSIFSCICRW